MNHQTRVSPLSSGLLRISGKTKVCGIIGDPVEHTLSPAMHNAAFRSLGLNYVYVPFHVRREELADAIRGIKSLGIVGVNVTMPHKTRVLRLLDKIDQPAREIGAVNTIVRHGNKLEGYNTDGEAALDTLSHLGDSLSSCRVVLLGAGGAARAIAYDLSKVVQQLTILNRTRLKASSIAAMVRMRRGAECRSLELGAVNLRKEVRRADMLINTLPVHVFPRFARLLIQERLVGSDMLILDINYHATGDFVAKAKQAGAKVADGLDMLVRQAELSFRLWTGRAVPFEVMREAAIRARATGR